MRTPLRRMQPRSTLSQARWGCSSAGRAPESHSGGRRFDPVHLHKSISVPLQLRLKRPSRERWGNDWPHRRTSSGGEFPSRKDPEHPLLLGARHRVTLNARTSYRGSTDEATPADENAVVGFSAQAVVVRRAGSAAGQPITNSILPPSAAASVCRVRYVGFAWPLSSVEISL